METLNYSVRDIDIEYFYQVFQKAYHCYQSKPFDLTGNMGEARVFSRTLTAYFLAKNAFLQSPLLHHASAPNLDKGLLVLGRYGTGKSSVFNTFHMLFKDACSKGILVKMKDDQYKNLAMFRLAFGFHSTNQIVRQFEGLKGPEEKEFFWKKNSAGTKYFDDLTTENQASYYGKIELFKDILELRYMNRARTFASMNFYGNSVEDTLDFLADRYGERVYDRLFEMFNIIELKGSSLRK